MWRVAMSAWWGANAVTMATVGQRVPSARDLVRAARAAWRFLKLTWRLLLKARPRHAAWTVLWAAHVLTFSTIWIEAWPVPARVGGLVLALVSGAAVGFAWSSRPPGRKMLRLALPCFATTAVPAALVLGRIV